MTALTFSWDDRKFFRHVDRFGAAGLEGARGALKKGLRAFETHLIKERLSHKSDDALFARTGHLRQYLVIEVRGRSLRALQGRIAFAMPRRLRAVPFVQEFGATIRAKHKGRPLRFKLYKKWSRGDWPFKKNVQWMASYEVVIPPRLKFVVTFQASKALILRAMVKDWTKFVTAHTRRAA